MKETSESICFLKFSINIRLIKFLNFIAYKVLCNQYEHLQRLAHKIERMILLSIKCDALLYLYDIIHHIYS